MDNQTTVWRIEQFEDYEGDIDLSDYEISDGQYIFTAHSRHEAEWLCDLLNKYAI